MRRIGVNVANSFISKNGDWLAGHLVATKSVVFFLLPKNSHYEATDNKVYMVKTVFGCQMSDILLFIT